MTKIIALAGRKQSGKTTASETIKDYSCSVLGYDPDKVVIYNFADPLKRQICMDILGLSYDECYGDDEFKNKLTDLEWDGKKLSARDVMQFIGTDIFRKMKHNVWADATLNRIKKESPQIAIIADCRFPNEVEAIKKHGGVVIKLMLNPFNSDHSSETALDPDKYPASNFDVVIFNNHLSIEHKNYAIIKFLDNKGILKL